MKNLASILVLIFLTIFQWGCKTEGCTDPKANNFIYEAEKDDGSCNYGGCTDKDALNYDPDALEDNGSCIYNGGIHFISNRSGLGIDGVFLSLFINGDFIGNLNQGCNISVPDCESLCTHVKFIEQKEGAYFLNYWEIQQTSNSTFDTLFQGTSKTVQLIGGECRVFTIE